MEHTLVYPNQGYKKCGTPEDFTSTTIVKKCCAIQARERAGTLHPENPFGAHLPNLPENGTVIQLTSTVKHYSRVSSPSTNTTICYVNTLKVTCISHMAQHIIQKYIWNNNLRSPTRHCQHAISNKTSHFSYHPPYTHCTHRHLMNATSVTVV